MKRLSFGNVFGSSRTLGKEKTKSLTKLELDITTYSSCTLPPMRSNANTLTDNTELCTSTTYLSLQPTKKESKKSKNALSKSTSETDLGIKMKSSKKQKKGKEQKEEVPQNDLIYDVPPRNPVDAKTL